MKNLFFTLEGIEGCGKTTQRILIENYLKESGHPYLITREPGGTDVSEKIRNIIVNNEMDPITEALLFAASRRQLVTDVVKPALNNGKIVICDRFIDSSIAYQGFGRGLGMDYIININKRAVDGCMPVKTFFLDISPEKGFERINLNNRDKNRLDNEKIEFYKKNRQAFFKLKELYPDRIVVIDADRPAEEVFEDIKKCINECM